MRKFLCIYIFVLSCIISNNSLHGVVITVSNNNDSGPGSLRNALQAANDGDTIRSNAGIGDITLNSKLPVISKNITIESLNSTPQEINANNHRAFVIENGKSVTIKNYTISNGHALGGKGGDAKSTCCAGGAGGGGLGAGGAVFVAENAFLTLDGRISLMDNSAEGGKGGGLVSTSVPSGSGGAGGGGGSFSDIDPNGLDPTSTTGANGGGDNAGMGGLPPSAGGFGGGGGGSSKNDSSTKGGDGGFGGGGAGSGDATSIIPSGDGGDGGFGGGGGGSGQTGGSGGNGGLYGGTGQTPAASSQGAGGGGAGLGGAVFIQDKGRLTIKNGLLFNTNTAVAGTGFNNGEAQGQDIFMMSGSTLIFDLSSNATIASDIQSDQGAAGGSGGGITKTGSAILTFSGTNTYTGGTSLLGGVLSVSKNSNLGKASDKINFNGGTLQATDTFSSTRDVTLTGPGTIDVNNGKILTMSGVMSGTGTLTKQNTGTLTLTGTNTYSGGTHLLGGILSVSEDTNLGAASGTLTFNDCTLQATDTFPSARNVTLTGPGTIDVDTGKTLTMSGVMSGTGSLTKQNTGTVVLTGTNTYSGGTTVSAGVLQGTTSSLQRAITNNASVVFDQTTTGTYSGVMSGTGSLTKQNTGTVALTGTNTYSGGTTVSAGVLQGTTNGLQRAITNNASVVFDQTTTGTYSGVMSGTGSLTKQNAGTVALTGTNTYSGGTNLLGGILSVSEDTNLGAASGILTFNDGTLQATEDFSSARSVTLTSPGGGKIDVDTGKTLMMTGILSGTGTLTKQNAGTLTLSGINTYSGGTNLSGGILSVSADANLGAASGTLIFNDGTLQATEDFSSARTVTLTGPGTIDVNSGKILTMSGVMSGTGSLTKQNTGTVVLTGTNTYSGGTTVSAGTLQGTTNGLQGAITNNASVVFDQTTTGTYSGVMSGTGTLTKQNTGTVVLTGTNTYSGGTTVSAGVLQGTTNSLQGAITNNASVVFDQTTTETYSGVMSGTGTLTKQNTGTVVLTGANTYTGMTNVRHGTLQVNGSITSPVTVFSSGILQGTGTVGTTQNNGIVSPGSSIGTLTVNGDYTHDPSAFLHIEIDDSPLASDLLLITGTANLDGSVRVIPCPGMYEAGMVFTFLQANTINGTFSQLLTTSPIAFVLNYLPNAVQLIILADQPVVPVPIDQLGGNAKNIADYLFSCSIPLSSSLTPILRALLKTSPSEFPQALLRLGPQQFGGLSLSNLQSHVRMSRSMNRTKEVFDQSYFSECHPRWNHPFIWLTPMGYYYKQNKVQGQTPFTDKTYGVTAGYGITFFDHLLVGGGIGYSHSDIDWEDNQGDATIHSVFLSPSVGYIGQYGYVGLVVTGSRSFYDVNRNVRFSTFKDSAHNDHKSYNLLTGLELGTYIKLPESFQKNLYFSPVAGLDYVNIFERGYQESGAGPINLSVQNKHTAFLHPKILLKLLKESQRSSLCVLPSLYIGYSSNVPLTNGTYTSRFYKQQACEKRFDVRSYDKTTHQMLLGAELKMLHKKHFESTIKYEAGLGSRYTIQEVNLNLSWNF